MSDRRRPGLAGCWFLWAAVLLGCGCSGTEERPAPADGPLRILSLSPNVTEILFAIGLGDKVVGVTDFCRYPPEATEKEKIGGLLNPNLEKMFALEPNLVIMLPAHGDLSRKMEKRGIATLVVPNDTVDDVVRSIEAIGGATGRDSAAAGLVGRIRSSIEKARARKPAKRWRTMMVVDRTRGALSDIYVAGPGTYLDEVIRIAGGENAFGDALARYPSAGLEEILHRNPEVIIELKPGDTVRREAEQEIRAEWERLPGLVAAEEGRIFVLAGEYLLVPGPRIAMAIDSVGALLEHLR